MSLLLDALKKSEQAKQAEQTPTSNSIPLSAPELTLQDIPNVSASTTASISGTQNAAPSRAVEMDAVRVAGQNLFASKAAPKRGGIKLGLVPIALITGVFFAVGGGIYIWLETAPPSTAPMPQRVAVAPAPVAVIPETPAHSTKDAGTTTGAIGIGAPRKIIDSTGQPAKIAQKKSAPRSNTPKTTAPATVNSLSPFIKMHGDNISPLLAEGYRAYRAGSYGIAEERYRAVLQLDAKNRDALLGLAAIAQQQKNDTVAMQYYGQILALDPRDPAAYAAMSALASNDPASAESRLKILLGHHPQAAILHFALGNVYAEQARWGDAQQAYFQAVNRAPENAEFNFNLAVSLDHLSQDKIAAQYYQRALQLNPSGAEGFNRSEAQARLQKLTAP